MIEKLDSALLALARNAAGVYQRLTGRDNFSLGRIFNIVWFAMLCVFCWNHPTPFPEFKYVRPFFFAVAGLVALGNALNLSLSESQADEDALRGAKQLGAHKGLQKERLQWLFVDGILLLAALFQRARYPSVEVFFSFFAIAIAGMVIVAYLRSIERPPYARFRVTTFARALAPRFIRK